MAGPSTNRLVDRDLQCSIQESGMTLPRHRANDKTATIDDLPTELFHNVLEHLECHDQDTLASCTLVCRDWLDISQQHLFSELHVLRSCDENFQCLIDWLEQHTAHAGYVRTLSLEARLVSVPPQFSLMPSLSLDTLSHLLHIIPNLQCLRLHQLKICPARSLPTPAPTPYPTPGQYSLKHMEYEKCLCELNRTFELLSWFHIDHLDYDPVFSDAEDPTVEPGDHKLDVHSLCVSPIAEDLLAAFRALQQFVRPNMLRSFRYPALGKCVSPLPVADFLRYAGQSLVDLDLCTTPEDDCLILPQLPSLQVFRYHTFVPLLAAPGAAMAEHQATFAPFRDVLLPRLPADLERLVLYVPYGDPSVVPGPDGTPLWGLERALTARFPGLRKLGFIFPDLPGDLAAATAAMGACFPALRDRGMLETSVRTWEMECREWDIYAYLHDC
ncbi:hypothetical protein GSI_14773 [Ganoderma sinense ZZ0214-1]|uniref:F-box domain-containing protein n=1 Tax=Ganoderma sinense ZZ0214-1 TaxID=1077348 RepID=A0A2G8RPM8_9APHY|nr:hypothetical protein GSI_14773 [Ganoderma sinense ZZ0214-1]